MPDSVKMPAAVTIGDRTDRNFFITINPPLKIFTKLSLAQLLCRPWRQAKVNFSYHSETDWVKSASRHGESVGALDQTVGLWFGLRPGRLHPSWL
jgi:hypothetical protein